jgi:hypothetical protein
LVGGFSGAENHLGKSFPERAVRIDMRESQVSERRGLESVEHLFPAGFSLAKILKQLDRFCGCHAWENVTKTSTGHAGKDSKLPLASGWLDIYIARSF